ncbi:hypothetical protein BB561_006961, partial [Smittium simulii]
MKVYHEKKAFLKMEKNRQANTTQLASIIHLLNNSKSKALKKSNYGGSGKKIGCGWTRLSVDIDVAIDHVALSIDDKY